MRKSYKFPFPVFLALMTLSATFGCAAQKVSVAPPPVAFQTETYVVVQTAPDNFTVLTRSKAAMEEVATRLGCDKHHVCAHEWNGEVWTIQRLK